MFAVLVNQKGSEKVMEILWKWISVLFFLPQGLQPYDITVMAIDTPQHVLYESCNAMHHCTLLLCSLPFKRLL